MNKIKLFIQNLQDSGHATGLLGNTLYLTNGSTIAFNGGALVALSAPDGTQGMPIQAMPEKPKLAAIPDELYMKWDDLDKGNKLQKIHDDNFTLFSVLYREKFGNWPSLFREKADQNLRILYEEALSEYKKKEMYKMSWDELVQNNLTKEMQKCDPNRYRELFFNKYGRYPRVI